MSKQLPLEYASRMHPGDVRSRMISALVKRGMPLDDAENAVTRTLDNPEMRRILTGETR
ncbi:hypothetical protein [Streptomyces mirabilis]|uniref:hypothetical protein n=1 Tax=Streptomyces mirabilis TaxID=68239 RepID=UPI0022568F58|nr:hypothetical protein [Streptomyces mirabilis]MCX4422513.1 hypothetical protein [Streptomyces mirabilis]